MFVPIGKQALGSRDDQEHLLRAEFGEMILKGMECQVFLCTVTPLRSGVKERAYGFVSGRVNKAVLESETRIYIMRKVGHGWHQI